MALNLNISICNADCESFLFSETTGSFNSVNTGGWGSPNPLTSSATSATLDVTTPDELIYNFNLFTSNFPTTDIQLQYQILGSSIGYSDTIADGKYTFTYTVIVSGTTYTITKNFYNICNIECCVEKMLLSIDDLNCDCNKEAKDKYLEAYTLLLGLKHAATCGNENDLDSLLSSISKLCANSSCKNCK